MDITITGRHLTLEERVQRYIREKIERVLRLHDRLGHAHVVLDQEKGLHRVEVTINGVRGMTFAARSEAGDLRDAVDRAEHKIENQVRAWKDRLLDHR